MNAEFVQKLSCTSGEIEPIEALLADNDSAQMSKNP
jgi:hypothetical protein